MIWANRYVGLPYRDQGRDHGGCDCWGLVRLVYAAELGIHLPRYTATYVCADAHDEVAALIEKEAVQGPWQQVATPQMFDVLLLRQGRFGSHVGLCLNGARMLHMAQGEQAKIEDYRSAKWGRRYLGAYRHQAREMNAVALAELGA